MWPYSMHMCAFSLCFCVSVAVCFSCVWCFGVGMIGSGYELRGGRGLTAAGTGSSQAPPRGLLGSPTLPKGSAIRSSTQRSPTLPKGSAIRSSTCFVQQTSLEAPCSLHHYPLGCSLPLCQVLWLQSQGRKLHTASDNGHRVDPSLL